MKHWYTDGTNEIQLQDGADIPEGFHKGRNISQKLKGVPKSEETKKKLSEARKGKTPWNKGVKEEIKHIYYTDGKTSIRLKENEVPPEGFYKGRIQKEFTKEELEIAKIKRQNTCLEKYGDAKYNNSEKNKETCINKYGVSNPLKLKEVQEKIIKTNLERYGVENVFQAEEIKSKIHSTTIKKYGVDNISQSLDNKDKIKKSWVTKSQEEIFDIVGRRRQTSLDRYGVDSPMKLQEVKDRVSETCMERYGVPFYTLTSKLSMSNDSKPNKEFDQLLTDNGIEHSREFVLGRKRFDFRSGNNLIEINPTETHNSTWGIFNEEGIDSKYHYNKSNLAKDNGYRCIHVWDWDDKNKIINLIKPKEKLFARKCTIKLVSSDLSKEFINKYHLQGNIKSDINIGLFFKDELVSIMTFGTPRYNKKYQYELLRYCSSYNVIGGAKKLFTYFIKNYKPTSIISYCDYSKFTGNVYTDLGFKYDSMSIGRHWYNLKTKVHITDNLLRQRGFDQLFGTSFGKGVSNEELMKEYGFLEIYDAGQGRYSWFAE